MPRNESESATPVSVGPEKSWNESQWFWWADAKQRVCGFHRIAHQPNRGNAHIWNVVIDDTGRYTRRVSSEVGFSDAMRGESHWSVERLSFRQREQGGLDCEMKQDDVRMELSFEDLYRAVSFDEVAPSDIAKNMSEDTAPHHFEVAGRIKGTVEIGNRTIDVSGLGHRDHSWGPRDVANIQSSTWTNGSVGEEFSFFATAAAMRGRPLIKLGYIVEHGTVTPLSDWNLYPWMEVDGVTYCKVTGYLQTVNGRRIDLEYTDLMGGTTVNLDEWIGFENAFNLNVEGKRGVANFERAVNPCGGNRMPTILLNGASEDGTGQIGRAQ